MKLNRHIISFIAGIIIILSGILVLINNKDFLEHSVRVTACIEEIKVTIGPEREKYYTPYVKYKYEDKEYKEVQLNTYLPSMKVGDYIEVFIDPINPGECRLENTNYILSVLLMIIGTPIMVYGFVNLIEGKKNFK